MSDDPQLSGSEPMSAADTMADTNSAAPAAPESPSIEGSKSPSLRDLILSTAKEQGVTDDASGQAKEPDASTSSGKPASEKAAAKTTESEAEAELGPDGKPKPKRTDGRDDLGRFAAKESETAPQGEGTAGPSETPAPQHWSPKQREAFDKLPPEAKGIVMDLTKSNDAFLTRTAQAYAADRQFAQSVRSLITPEHRAQMQAAGMTSEADGFKYLVTLQDMATKQPREYLRRAMGWLKQDPRQVFPEFFTAAQGAQPGEEFIPPQQDVPDERFASMIDARLAPFTQAVQTLVDRTRTQDQQTAAQMGRMFESSVQSFQSAKDANGNLLYPHYERLRYAMADLMDHPHVKAIGDHQPGEQLKEAYQLALLGDPDLRNLMVEQEAERRVAERLKATDIERARRAAPAVRPAPAALSRTQARPTSIRDAVQSAAQELGMRT